MTHDDSALLSHRAKYDPSKAHEYYLRTRKLKGRRARLERSSGDRGTTPQTRGQIVGTGRRQSGTDNEARRQAHAQAEQRLAALQSRLDRLRDLLAEKVQAAMKRSGIETKSTDTKSTADKKSSEKADKPATPEEKRKAAKRAKEEYDKNKKTASKDPTVAKQIEQVEQQIRDVKAQLKEAAANARKSPEAQSKTKTGSIKGRRQ